MTRTVWPEAENIGPGTDWRSKLRIFGFIVADKQKLWIMIHYVDALQLLCKKVLDTFFPLE